MASVTLFNAARTQAIEDNAINSGFVDANGKLILVKHNGVQMDAGNVVGPKGDDSRFPLPGVGSPAAYLRLATLDGIDTSNGANYNALISGIGDFGSLWRATLLIHATQRGNAGIALKAWSWDLDPAWGIKLYTKSLGPYLFEIWIKLSTWTQGAYITELATWHATRNLNGLTTTMPTSLVEATVQNSEYVPKAVISDKLADSAIVKGVLEASYRGGAAKVKIDGVWSSETYPWLTPYNPAGSRQVRLMRTASGLVITGQAEDDTYPLTLTSNWRTYGENGSGSWAGIPKAVKLPSGLVMLNGFIGALTTPVDGQIIAVLPEGYRPDTNMLFPVENVDTAKAILIEASTGNIKVYGSGWSITWTTLTGIAFWSAGVAQWTNVGSGGSAWGTNFNRNPDWIASYGEPGFWKDPYGFVWFRGLAMVTVATSTDNQPIFTIPSTIAPMKEEHHRVTANQVFGGIGADSTKLKWKQGSPGTVGTWLSLASVVLQTTDAANGNPWQADAKLLNSWAYYSSTFTVPRVLLREDGLRISYGMVNAGVIGSSMFVMPSKEFWPTSGRLTVPVISNGARGRFTLMGEQYDSDAQRGAFIPEQGSTAWFSLDGRVWIP